MEISVKGYNVHGRFGEYCLPVSVQNILHRGACHENSWTFRLSVNEIFQDRSHVNLISLLNSSEIKQLDVISVCSWSVINPNYSDQIFDLLERNGVRFWSIFERCWVDRGLFASNQNYLKVI